MYYRTPPLAVVDLPAASSHYGGVRIFPPKFIYLHHTGGTDSRDWLTHTSVPPVSCHRLIVKNGTIYKIVSDEARAWTQGNGVMGKHAPHDRLDCNDDGLSIEVENLGSGKDAYPYAQILSVARQVNEWWGMYGYLPVLAHYDVDPAKNDPRGFPWVTFYKALRGLQVGS